MKTLTIATRPSTLAVAQSQTVISALRHLHPKIRFRMKKIATAGDKEAKTSLQQLKTPGVFTSQLQRAVLTGQADLAVHSFKDLPIACPDELTIAAVLDRKFPEDVLITAKPISSLDDLSSTASIGTSSLRRIALIKHQRRDLQFVRLRGNVPTRLAKLDAGPVDAIVLARAGIERLGLGHRISLCFDPTEFVSAPAQGALAVQTRADDLQTNNLVAAIDDNRVRTVTKAERKVLALTGAGCHAPIGVFAKITGSDIIITVFVSDIAGENFVRRQIRGPVENAEQLVEKLAEQLLDDGGRAILKELKIR